MSKNAELAAFNRLYPQLRWLLSEVDITDQLSEYQVNGYKFLAKLRGNIMEFSPANEEPIFPTVAYEINEDGSTNLLYFRVGGDLFSQLNLVMAHEKDSYYSQIPTGDSQ